MKPVSAIEAECQCGEVIFSLASHLPGDVLTCPWCARPYRYLGDGQIEPLYGEARAAGAGLPTGTGELQEAGPGRGAPPPLASEASAGEEPHSARLQKPASARPMPGGVWAMVAFGVAGNVLAFTFLFLVFPRQPDGVRLALWGGALSAPGAIWPEVVTLAVGHLMGFTFWVSFLAWRLRRQALVRGLKASALPSRVPNERRS
jgi:hypothetical protein